MPANPGGVAYGLIAIGALLAAESGHHEGYADAIASALIATALYWLAHAYAGELGRRLATNERLTASALARALARDWAIVRGAAVPLAALVAAWLAGAAQEAGVTAALWSAVGGVVALELAAGLRSRARPRELLLETGVGAAMGLAIIAMKVLLA